MSSVSESETVLQLGAGRFLRAFVDRFLQQANDAGQNVGRVVIVQSTPGQRADKLNHQPDGFHVLVRGLDEGEIVERVDPVRSVGRALNANDQWEDVLDLSRSNALRYLVSNATEAGYVLSESDTPDSRPPKSLPGKITQLLWARFLAGGRPLVLIPCELIERNADKLRDLVLLQCQKWQLAPEFQAYVSETCTWLNNLVDCIVTNAPADHPLAQQDNLLVQAEPYTLWAIERPAQGLPEFFRHPAIQWVDDLMPWYLKKVRILNGLHSAMVGKFLNSQFETVQQVLADRDAARWIRGLLFEEIVPTIAYRVPDVAQFADQTWDRLRNPFLAHRLQDIALNHSDKVRVRLQPTYEEYFKLFGSAPRHLAEVVSAL
ncbi:MAG: Mannitol dehydrogenase rossman domain protein [Planctomycetaceae bacterium]|nr:Mannitol dehydrogenase rossman domain protein [Planctomycetaceae bacterium]